MARKTTAKRAHTDAMTLNINLLAVTTGRGEGDVMAVLSGIILIATNRTQSYWQDLVVTVQYNNSVQNLVTVVAAPEKLSIIEVLLKTNTQGVCHIFGEIYCTVIEET
jgi:hypothetical protein